jgi:hypothetical protein
VTWIYADAHVHFHDCFDLERLLAAAAGRSAELGGPLLLLLAEHAAHDAFGQLRRSAGAGADSGPRDVRQGAGSAGHAGCIRLRATSEPHSLAADSPSLGAAMLRILNGRQVVSKERIEVLALGLDPADPFNEMPDGMLPTDELVSRALAAGAATVLPWGFGKWIGARGGRVIELARREELRENPLFFLGDIAHRCWPWPVPEVFHGPIRVLPGSDPLPLPGSEGRLARYGFRVEGSWDPERPAGSLLRCLREGAAIEPIGRRESPWATLSQQLRYRLRRA